MQTHCHPEQATEGRAWLCHPERDAFCLAKDPGGPRDVSRSLRHNNRAFGSLLIHFVGLFCSAGAAGLANFASSTATFSFTSLT
jgi:hypothetical protein